MKQKVDSLQYYAPTKKKKILPLIILNIILFIYIYLPLFSISPKLTSIFLPLILISVCFFFYNKSFKFSLKRKIIALFSLGIIAIIIYSNSIDLIANNFQKIGIEDLHGINFIRIYIDIILGAIAIYIFFKYSGLDSIEDLIKCFFIISLAQFIFCFLMLLNPQFRDFILFDVLQSSDKILSNEVTSTFSRIRGFGIASGYLFSFPLFNGFVVCCAFWFAIEKKIYYLIFVLTAFLPIIVNARIGIICIPIFLVSYILIKKIKLYFFINFMLRNFLAIVLLTPLIIFGFILFQQYIPTYTFQWFLAGIWDLINIIGFNQDEYSSPTSNSASLNKLSSKHLVIPDTLEGLWFGNGSYSSFTGLSDFSSDIGYIQLLFFGGIIYLLMILYLFLFLLYKSFKHTQSDAIKGIILCGGLMMIVSNFKGLVFITSNSFLRALILVCFFILLDSRSRSIMKTNSSTISRKYLP